MPVMSSRPLSDGSVNYHASDSSIETRLELVKWILEEVRDELYEMDTDKMSPEEKELRSDLHEDISYVVDERLQRIDEWLENSNKDHLEFFLCKEKENKPESEGLEQRFFVLKLKDPSKNVDSIVLEFDDKLAREAIMYWVRVVTGNDTDSQLFKDVQKKCLEYERSSV